MSEFRVCWVLGLSALFLPTAAYPDTAEVRPLPPPANRPIVFGKDIQPIFEASCTQCHGRERDKGGFRIDTRETLLRGGESGPAVVVGQSAESLLVKLVAGSDPERLMPRKGTRLTEEQIGLLRAWIDQGLLWGQGISFARPEPRNLKPQRPGWLRLPDTDGNLVDQVLKPYFAQHPIGPLQSVDDRTYARRVYLDLVGLLPPADGPGSLASDGDPNLRRELVRRLLDDRAGFAENWLSFWNDLLRNDYHGAGYIDGGRKQITAWLYSALSTNLPYDRFVARLINPGPETEGFTKGIVWRGVVNASQAPAMQAAQNVAQVFLGVNLKCASCHDSFINDWKLSDSYGLACVYSDSPLEMFRCDKPTGQTAQARFIYPELGEINGEADKAARLARLAQIMTSSKNGRLSRTIVNRLWARFFGRGLVEPVDDMEQPAWNPDLLDALAEDLAANHYDLKHTIQLILTSQAYQLPSVNPGETAAKEYVFKGPAVRRMTAEQFRDAVGQLTGAWFSKAQFGTGTKRIRCCLVDSDPLTQALGRPPRDQVVTSRAATATTLQALELSNGATLANLLQRGAWLLTEFPPSGPDLVNRVFETGLGREPTRMEAEAALGLVGRSARPEGSADLLWAMTMLPEFQLIY